MNCPKCKQAMRKGREGDALYYVCRPCNYLHLLSPPESPLRDTEKRPAAAERKKPAGAQKAVQKAKSEDNAYLFGQAWCRLCKPRPYHLEGEYYFAKPQRDWRFDWAFASEKVSVEVDGGQWMPGGGKHGSDGDRDKLNEAAAMGWLVFRFSPKQLRDDPEKCVRQVERALRLRGEEE